MRADNITPEPATMSGSSAKPLLTFALVSCNQDRYVREAVGAAFAQTYSPLEIILSDDCSDDRSFDIMREMAAAYRGPHTMVLNRNPVRRRTGGHFNRVLELAKGELIVIAAADDVSMPERTEAVYRVWMQSGKRATSIYSDLIQIDEDGRQIEDLYDYEQRRLCGRGEFAEQRTNAPAYVATLKPAVHGCAHIISPVLFKVFGNMPEQVMYEDKVLAFRSVLAGTVLYINEPLVKYRLHGANILKYRKRAEDATDLNSLERQEDRLHRDFVDAHMMHDAFLQDLRIAKDRKLLSEEDFENATWEATHRGSRYQLMAEFMNSGFFKKCWILLKVQRLDINRADLRTLLNRLVPRSLFLRIRLARSRTNSSNRSAKVRTSTG
jgi:glycosyltransferase involved in cell wall biosynthesis